MSATIPYYKGPVRFLFHLAFLLASYLLLLQVFTTGGEVAAVDHVYTALFFFTLLPLIYLNLEFMLPQWSSKGKWHFYIISLLFLLSFTAWLNIQLLDKWSVWLFPDYYFISFFSFWQVWFIALAFIILTSLIKLSKSWFEIRQLQQKVLLLEKETADRELAALKAQVNPHFFFNTLNSMYALSLTKDDRLPSALLQLSSIMRYYLYEAGGEKVPLEKEISRLKDYVQLQRMRIARSLDLRFEDNGSVTEYTVPPLLLVTLAENAFKHGARGVEGNAFIHMHLEAYDSGWSFLIRNSKGQKDESLDEEGGLGLQNIRRRLELLYPGRHTLEIKDDPGVFTVKLTITHE